MAWFNLEIRSMGADNVDSCICSCSMLLLVFDDRESAEPYVKVFKASEILSIAQICAGPIIFPMVDQSGYRVSEVEIWSQLRDRTQPIVMQLEAKNLSTKLVSSNSNITETDRLGTNDTAVLEDFLAIEFSFERLQWFKMEIPTKNGSQAPPTAVAISQHKNPFAKVLNMVHPTTPESSPPSYRLDVPKQ
ncbi:hypothetical protein GCK72_012655 [Caenorhabditis remanei]|uniref:Uncharacterized protein n=1 Tax=Caenorhabditis remanei TaxID=31234 RepID=A0A6A5GP77_CAERE|nr:hypothetical protein GCK72_012655 [Caenorhabditis remanei]KAF1756202.1 hypothetical protein GCK72_012655 [Caenorhabditis remanei]